jgi:hypothetical protein
MVTLRPVIEEAQRIAKLTQLNIFVDECDSTYLEIAIHKMVLAEIVEKYTLIDEELCAIIQKYFLGTRDRSTQFRLFRQLILDELYLIKKIEIVHAIKDIPKSVRNTISDLNYILMHLLVVYIQKVAGLLKSIGKFSIEAKMFGLMKG